MNMFRSIRSLDRRFVESAYCLICLSSIIPSRFEAVFVWSLLTSLFMLGPLDLFYPLAQPRVLLLTLGVGTVVGTAMRFWIHNDLEYVKELPRTELVQRSGPILRVILVMVGILLALYVRRLVIAG